MEIFGIIILIIIILSLVVGSIVLKEVLMAKYREGQKETKFPGSQETYINAKKIVEIASSYREKNFKNFIKELQEEIDNSIKDSAFHGGYSCCISVPFILYEQMGLYSMDLEFTENEMTRIKNILHLYEQKGFKTKLTSNLGIIISWN